MPDKALIIARPHPFATASRVLELATAKSLLEILEEVQPDPYLRRRSVVYLDGRYIEPAEWSTTYPPPGAHIHICCRPQGFVVAIFTAMAAALAAKAVSAAVGGGLLGTILGTLTGVGITFLGILAAKALVPPPSPRRLLPRASESKEVIRSYSIETARNRLEPYGVVPSVLGRHRMTPPFAARPWTEAVGNDQYLRVLLLWGYGPVKLEDLRIGETPITSYQGVTIEHRYGYPDDQPVRNYPYDVYQEDVATVLQPLVWVERVTQPDTDEISIDFAALRGLYSLTSRGQREAVTVQVEVWYQRVGDDRWLDRPLITLWGATGSVVRQADRWQVPRGQYTVRCRRLTHACDATSAIDEISWLGLRSIHHRAPIDMPVPVAVTAIDIRASEQLSGVVDTINAVVSRLILDWDKHSRRWVLRETSNPASIYRHILQGPENHQPLPDTEIDLEMLQEWHEFCEVQGFTFDHVVDYECDVEEILSRVAAAGRASSTWRDGRRSVVIDRPQPYPVALFTPRNSWGIQGEKLFPDLPHALRCRYVNRRNDWRSDEMIVYADGYDSRSAVLYEEMECYGLTDPDHVYKLARYHLAVGRLRAEEVSFWADIEHFVVTRGDRILVQHDVTLWGICSGRITELITSAGYLTGIRVDEVCQMLAGRSYNVRLRYSDGTQTVRAVITQEGENRELYFTQPMTMPWPQVGDLFVFGEAGRETADLLVRDVEMGESGHARLVCVPYDERVYRADTEPIPVHDPRITTPAEWYVPTVLDIRSDATVLLRAADGSWLNRILITLQPVPLTAGIIGVEAEYYDTAEQIRRSTGLVSLSCPELSIFAVEAGRTYRIRLRYHLRGGPGPWSAEISHTVVGKEAPPSDVTGFRVTQQGATLNFRWNPVPDLDLAGYVIKYGPPGVAWEAYGGWFESSWLSEPWFVGDDAELLASVTLTNNYVCHSPEPGRYDFLVKAIDTSGNYSRNAARASLVVYQFVQVLYDIEWAPFDQGELVNMVRDPLSGTLEPADQVMASGEDYSVFDDYCVIPYGTQRYTTPEIDLGDDRQVRLWATCNYRLGADEPMTLPTVTLQYNYRQSTGEYVGWQDLENFVSVLARYVRFRLVIENGSQTGAVAVTSLRTVIDRVML